MSSEPTMDQNEPLRIVLLGKTGAGKSSLANLIYGEDDEQFKESASANSETKQCSSKDKMINGQLVRLIDTPGLFDTDDDTTELSAEILRCIRDCAPGPHAFLLVLKVERFTKQENEVVQEILKHFSDEALDYTTVVFTHGDQLKDGVKIKDWVLENKGLSELVEKCGNRCHVFDKKYWKDSTHPYRNNQNQVTELLETIKQTMREKNWKHYTNKYLEFLIKNMAVYLKLHLKYTARLLWAALLGVEALAKGIFESSSFADEDETPRIVLIGKTGVGKSSLANTIVAIAVGAEVTAEVAIGLGAAGAVVAAAGTAGTAKGVALAKKTNE